MLPEEGTKQKAGWRAGITRNVVVLGVASLFTDISSEMIIPLRLIFLVQVLGTPLALAGLVEGLAEGATSILRLFAGRLADRVGRRVPLVIAGVSVSNLVKPLLALVTTWPQALGILLVDRAGKSLRVSPRDAIIADAATARHRGKAFGFHRGMDTLGAAIGPLLAIIILTAHPTGLREVFAWTVVPGLLAILVVVLFLRGQRSAPAASAPPPAANETPAQAARPAEGRLGTRFWLFVIISTVFALGNSSDAFIFLRTEGLEQSLAAVPLLYFGFNLLYAVLATPLGVLSDRWGRLPVLLVGYAAFALVYLGWAMASRGWQAWGLFLIYAVYYGATEGVARAFVGDLVPRARRGTALGWFNGLTGLAAVPANVLGGWLWVRWGPVATFGFSAWAALVALGLLIGWWPWLRRAQPPSQPGAQSAEVALTPSGD
ncbi:MAG TPA: MFS transporter [Ktedonobacterales bacterium]|jgi:MFS family permease